MGINAILSGLQKTLLNNAVQSKAPNPRTQINVNPATVQRAGLKAPLPSEKIQIGSPNINLPSPQIQQSMMGPRQPNMKDVALIVGAGEKASNVASSAGFQFLNPPDPVKDPAGYFKYRNDEATNNLVKLGLQKDTAVAEMNKVVKQINEVYASDTIDKLQQNLLDIIKKGQPKQQFTSSRDFFIETDKSGKERLSNRGVATLTLAALAGLFGNPTQTSQTSQLVMGLGDKYAKEKNLFNEAKFKAEVADYNNQIQKVQTGISIASQQQQRKLAPLQTEYNRLINDIKRIDDLTVDEQKTAKAFAEKMATIGLTATGKDRTSLISAANTGLRSDDPLTRVNSWFTLQSLGIDVPAPFTISKEGKMEITPTIGERVKEATISRTTEATKKIIQDTQAVIDKIKRDDEKLKLEKEKFEFDKKYKDNLIKLRKAMVSIAGKNASSYASFTAQQKSALQFSQQFAKDEINKLDKSIATAQESVNKLDKQIGAVDVIEDPKLRETIKSNAIKARDAAQQKLDGLKKERTERVNDFTKINKFINVPGQSKTGANTNTRMPGRLPAPDIQPLTVNAKSYGLPEGVPAFVNPQFFPRVASRKPKGRNA